MTFPIGPSDRAEPEHEWPCDTCGSMPGKRRTIPGEESAYLCDECQESRVRFALMDAFDIEYQTARGGWDD